MSEEKRTIEVPTTATLSFKYRADGDVAKADAKDVLVKIDLSKLSAEDLLEWAFSAMVVSYQSKLRSKNPPVAIAEGERKGEYDWSVPSRGTRSTTDPKKVEEQAGKLLSKMSEDGKKELLYKTLLSIGKSTAEATAISGWAPTPEVKK